MQEKSQIVDFERQKWHFRRQTLEIRRQRGRFSRSTRRTRRTRRTRCTRKSRRTRKTRSSRSSRKTRSTTACNGQAREKAIIISRYTCAYARTLQEFCVFCCHKCHKNSIIHYVITIYIDFRNNIPHCHTFTLLLPPKKLPKTPSSKQLLDLQSKTTRHFPQNDTLFSVKRYVVFYKMTRCFL